MVLSSGRRPVSASTLRASSSLSAPGAVRNASALPMTVERVVGRQRRDLLVQPASRLSRVWRSLKRMLKRAVASPGMTLAAGLPMSIVVTCRFEGSNQSVPWSSGVAIRRSSTATSRCAALSARCG